MAPVYVRSIMRNTMNQKAPFCSPEMAQWKLVLKHVGSALLKSIILIIRKSFISRINEVFPIKYRYSIFFFTTFIVKRWNQSNLLLCWHGFCDVNVTLSKSVKSRPSVRKRLIPQNWPMCVQIACWTLMLQNWFSIHQFRLTRWSFLAQCSLYIHQRHNSILELRRTFPNALLIY